MVDGLQVCAFVNQQGCYLSRSISTDCMQSCAPRIQVPAVYIHASCYKMAKGGYSSNSLRYSQVQRRLATGVSYFQVGFGFDQQLDYAMALSVDRLMQRG